MLRGVWLQLHDRSRVASKRVSFGFLRFIREFHFTVFYTRMILVRQDFKYSAGPMQMETGSAAHP